jgi:GTP-binding protein EngB required for normal cell division
VTKPGFAFAGVVWHSPKSLDSFIVQFLLYKKGNLKALMVLTLDALALFTNIFILDHRA